MNQLNETFNTEYVSSNLNQFRNIRTYGALNAGIISGIFGVGKIM